MALRQTLQAFIERESSRADQASLGYLDNATGEYITDAPGNDGYVFVTYGGEDGFGGVIGIARNFQGAAPKVPVFVRGRGGVARVVTNNDSKTAAYNPSANNNYAYSVQKHSHGVGLGNVDPVQANRFIPGLVRPFKEGGSFGLKVYIEATQYEYKNTLTWFPGRDLDLSSFEPGTPNEQAWIVCGIDPVTNAPTAKSDVTYTTAASMNPSQLDGFDFSGNIPLGAVILRNGQTAINTFKDFADLRVFASSLSTVVPNIVTVTGDYTTTDTDNIILVDATGGNVIVTLQAVATRTQKLTIKRIDSSANTVSVDGDGAETIDDDATKELDQYSSMQIISDGIEWWIV